MAGIKIFLSWFFCDIKGCICRSCDKNMKCWRGCAYCCYSREGRVPISTCKER